MGVVIAPVLGEVGEDGYGEAQSWAALDASEDNVLHRAEKVTLVRRWIREQSKANKKPKSKKSK